MYTEKLLDKEVWLEWMHMSAIDSAFRRDMLEKDGRITEDSLPSPVQEHGLDFFRQLQDELDAVDIIACATSCSFGPITVVCDGTSK